MFRRSGYLVFKLPYPLMRKLEKRKFTLREERGMANEYLLIWQ